MNTKNLWIFLLLATLACSPKSTIQKDGQETAPEKPLLVIGNQEVSSSEFLYLFTKNKTVQNKEEALSTEEFDQNLEMFINFKLKVAEAESRGLDKVEEFNREFEIFKQDLIKPFLIKNSLQEGELMKAYNRMKEVVKASHILLQFPANASKEDTIAVFRMAQKLKTEAENGADFNELALEHSDDPSARENKGSLGYFTALQMVHQFEDAAYSLQIGQISDPILTDFGYHIIKLEDRKPNPGEVRVSHILVRSQGDPVSEERAMRKVGEIYMELQKAETVWETVCQQYSEDFGTKNTGGRLPWISLGTVIPEFERVAFALSEEGEISPPVKTPYGYHIIRLEERRGIAEYEELEPMLKSRILRDSRSTLIQSQVMAIQKSRFGFSENESLTAKVRQVFDQNSKQDAYRQLEAQQMMGEALFTIETEPYTLKEFIQFMEGDNQLVRIGNNNFFETWLDKYMEVSLNEAEEAYLEKNNDEYRMLLKEYRDGILLFSLMNEQVWQKALEDSAGQVAFYEKNLERYQWKDRVNALIVTMGKEESVASVRRFLSDKVYRKDLQDRLENTFLLRDPLAFTMEEGLYEWENHPVLKKMDSSKTFNEIKVDNRTYFVVLGNKVAPGPKQFMETRGKVIQDYQESLDQNLVQSLREKFAVRIDEKEKEKLYNILVGN